MMIYGVGFVICATVIFYAGKKLSYYGDIIAEKTGLGKAWFGLILMASITSLPELVVGISSSAIIKSANLAVGDILGSCAFNLGILALLDAVVPNNKNIFSIASQSHVLAASMGIILIAMVGFGILLPHDIIITPGIGVFSVLAMVVYLLSIRLIYRYEHKLPKAYDNGRHTNNTVISLNKAIRKYVLFAIVTVLAALFLPVFAEHIATGTGLSMSFVGTLFLAVSTSLLEIAISFSAVRMGAIDMSVGNLLGSNIFNILILAIDDMFYAKGPILKDVGDENLVSILSTITMSAIAIIGLTYRSENKRFPMAWDAIMIFSLFVLNVVVLYMLTK